MLNFTKFILEKSPANKAAKTKGGRGEGGEEEEREMLIKYFVDN